MGKDVIIPLYLHPSYPSYKADVDIAEFLILREYKFSEDLSEKNPFEFMISQKRLIP